MENVGGSKPFKNYNIMNDFCFGLLDKSMKTFEFSVSFTFVGENHIFQNEHEVWWDQ